MAAVPGGLGRLLLLLLLLLLGLVVSVASGATTTRALNVEQPPRPPRIYAAAPSGVDVTVVRAVELDGSSRRLATEPRYSLNPSKRTDYRFFNIDERHGNITTARYLERLVGGQYKLMVMVLASGQAVNKDLTITVTEYNKFAPVFDRQHYSAEVVETAGVGTPLLTVTATDQDTVDYNRDIRYFLADPSVPFYLNSFLDPLEWSPMRVDPRTGVVRVARALPLLNSPLHLLVGAVDGGSPQRYALANLTIYIRDMSVPLSVFVTNTSETSLTVCWSPPAFGHPEGYILRYIPVGRQDSHGEGFLNLTLEQLHTKLSAWSGEPEVPVRGDGVLQVYRYCAVMGGLMGWTQYQIGVRAWAGTDISVTSAPVMAITMSDYCAEGVCGVGNCSLQQNPPGYSCQCPPGYYGNNCEHHNPCLPDNPCSHLGRCLNNTDGSYTCDCLQGFYGSTCILLDPCVAVSANPCANGGSCFRSSKLPQNSAGEQSGQYECVCPEGYYGVMCEHRDPCLPNPCQHGASCSSLLHTSLCVCPSGYTGPRCEEEVNECDPNPCVDGECIDLLNDYQCRCQQGWGGKNCEEDLDECASFPCFNGATCIDGQASFVCDCAHGYSGIRCGIPESCPAQKTLLSTGEFLWPSTHHGESVTISCPYGTRIHSFEDRSTTETATSLHTPVTSGRNKDGDLDLEEMTLSTEHPQVSGMTTTYAEWEGGSFHINRKSRDVYFPSHVRENYEEKRHRLLSSLRGFSSRRSERRHYSQRQHGKEGQVRHATERQNLKRQESFTPTEDERAARRHPHSTNQTDAERDRDQDPDVKEQTEAKHKQFRDLDISADARAEPRIGSLLIREPYNRAKLQDTDKQMINPFMHDMLQVHPKLINSKGESLGHPNNDTSNDERQEEEENIPDNLTLQADSSVGRESDSINFKNLGKFQVSINKSKNSTNISITSANETHGKKAMEERTANNKAASSGKATRSCVLLPNGTVMWREPDSSMCREKATQAAEKAAEEVAYLTASPSTVDSEMFTRAADQLAKIVDHAVKDRAVARNMVHALSNMMEVNDSVVAAVDSQGNVTRQILETIKTFTQNVALEVGESVKFGSQHLVVEARLLGSSVNENIIFHPSHLEHDSPPTPHSRQRRKRNIDSSAFSQEPYISLPPQVLKLAGTKNIRLEFVSYANDKFFRSEQQSRLPVITAGVTNTEVSNLSHPVLYSIPLKASHTSEAVRPICVFWDEKGHEWSTDGLQMVQIDGKNVCQSSHLTAFSVLLDPLPADLGSHAEALSIITYIGLILSTASLIATVATYALFRTLNRDRSGKIVMNLSLVLLLLNIVFIIAVNLKLPSVACTAVAAVLHYLVVAAFAWMLVEAANMYQLLITVFASAETHFMAKRVFAAWGVPVVLVVIALSIDKRVYGDPDHGHCVISPVSNPALYYSTYLGPICLVLLVNCVVFVMVTRVLCQRRPRSNKPKAPSNSPSVEMPITLAQVRGAVTVVALLGITWVAGALSLGGARLALQYVFCITTPLQGLVIFIVRVAQHPEARAAWITLFTTGTLRRRPPTTHTHSTHSSGHTHSTSSVANTPRNICSSTLTTSTRTSLRTSTKPTFSAQKNGSVKSWSSKNGDICKYTTKKKTPETDSNMGTVFSRLVKRLSTSGPEDEKDGHSIAKNIAKTKPGLAPVTLPDLDCPRTLNQDQSYFCEAIPEKRVHSSYKKRPMHRPQSLVLLRTDSHGSVMATQSSTLSQDHINPRYPLLSSTILPQELIEVGILSSMVPRRSLGSLMLITGGKEGDDSSWHFVRPPPDGHSNPVSEGESVLVETDNIISTKGDTDCENPDSHIEGSETRNGIGCIVLSGQRVTTRHSPISGGKKKFCIPNLTRANSELQMGSPHINSVELRRSVSVYTLGEWEDPRSSLA